MNPHIETTDAVLHPKTGSRPSIRLWIEFGLLYIGLPLLVVMLSSGRPVLPILWGAAAVCGIASYRLSKKAGKPDRTRPNARTLRFLLARGALGAILLAVLLRVLHPDLWLALPRNRPILWLAILILYPILSVIPQGIVYRRFFMLRYRDLLGNGPLLDITAAALFGFSHIVFRNFWAVLFTAIGGWFFIRTYRHSGRLLLSNLEHAFYGGAIFTIGWGAFFYNGTTATLANAAESLEPSRVRTLESGTAEAIQSAIDQSKTGDTLVIPAGTWPISGTVRLREGLHIRGMGRDRTILVKSVLDKNPIFQLDAVRGEPFTISHLTFRGLGLEEFRKNPASRVLDNGVALIGGVKDFQIHHCRFEGFTGQAVYLLGMGRSSHPGHPTGVIWGNEFRDLYYVSDGDARGYGVGAYGDDSEWAELKLGDGEALFVEDNQFLRCRHVIAGNSGIRYVFRYNTITDNYSQFGAVDTHGRHVSKYGSRSFEVYGNRFTGGVIWPDQKPVPGWAFGIRGGDGVLFSNRFDRINPRIGFVILENWTESIKEQYPVAGQTTSLWMWGNLRDGQPMNSLELGWESSHSSNQSDALAPFFIMGRDIHLNRPKPDYVPFTYPHPLRGRSLNQTAPPR
ncbi:MAG: hypothetical protein U1E27_00625 [Kiritimatiellia bacterium]|nr:hypothetical protein [Kiritimatiellia bacterium]